MNLRSKPVDKRYLSKEERVSYRPSQRSVALSRAKQRRGQLAWENKVAIGTQEQKPGSGGLSMGRGTQGQRQRQKSAELARSKALRDEDPNI